jgi:arsenate reductase
MAEAYLRHFGGDKLKVYSAGVETHGLNPKAVEIMAEDGIDISRHTSNHVDEYAEINFDLVITVCDHAKSRCPVFPTKATPIHYNFSDPAKAKGNAEEVKQQFRLVRDEIKAYCKKIGSNEF